MLDKFKDECGVFGIFGHPEAANLTYLGLYALQHRGQESAGIATADGEKMRISRAMGHVADAFDEAALEALPGHIAIGHTRYSTAGESRLLQRAADPDRLRPRPDRHRAQRQPRERAASCATAGPRRLDLPDQQRHRGRAAPLRPLARAHGRRRAGRIDRAGQRRVFARAADEGPADRRARSARLPSALRSGSSTAPTSSRSETCALDLIGATYIRDVEPGEVLIISDGGLRSLHPFPPAPLAHCVFEHVYFARPDSYVFGRSVNDVRTAAGAHPRRGIARRRRRRQSRFPTRACAARPASPKRRGSRWRWG